MKRREEICGSFDEIAGCREGEVGVAGTKPHADCLWIGQGAVQPDRGVWCVVAGKLARSLHLAGGRVGDQWSGQRLYRFAWKAAFAQQGGGAAAHREDGRFDTDGAGAAVVEDDDVVVAVVAVVGGRHRATV